MQHAATSELLAGRYRLERLLGRGGMAEVWAASDERLGREVAVKLLAAELADHDDFRRRFRREARAAARLNHPNVVAVFDTGEHGGRPFLVMEHVEGETLAERLRAGPLDDVTARRLAKDVLAALTAAHAAGVLHRDVKPANILLGRDGTAKLADFGIARLDHAAHRDRTSTDVLVGTPAYLAPERLDGGAASPASDVYSLGVVLYEALTGDRPFRGDTPVAVALAVREGVSPLTVRRPGVERSLAAAVDRAMAVDPAARFSDAPSMARALDARVAEDPDATTVLSAPPPEPRRDAVAAIVSPRRSAVVGALLVLAAVVGLVVLATGLRGDGSGSRAEATAGSTAATGTSTPLARELRALAARLNAPDGVRAGEAAARLAAVADAIDAGEADDAADLATEAAKDLEQWWFEGRLGRTATEKALALLARVPGAEAPAMRDRTTPDADGSGGEDKGKGKGRGKDGGDD